jgi:hypothetical protein
MIAVEMGPTNWTASLQLAWWGKRRPLERVALGSRIVDFCADFDIAQLVLRAPFRALKAPIAPPSKSKAKVKSRRTGARDERQKGGPQ